MMRRITFIIKLLKSASQIDGGVAAHRALTLTNEANRQTPLLHAGQTWRVAWPCYVKIPAGTAVLQ